MRRNWKFQSNTFDVVTKTSSKKMLILGTSTDSKLAASADPAIVAIYNIYHPVFDVYRQLCANYDVVSGERKGDTLNLDIILKVDMPEKIRIWEPAVRIVYPEGSPQEKAIFPNGRAPFMKGAYEERIKAVNALANKLATDPAFAALTPQVQSFYNLLLSARDTQLGKKGSLETLSSQRDNQRILLSETLFGTVLSGVMKRFATDPAQIVNYFDMSLLRTPARIPATTLIIRGKVTIAGGSTPVVDVPVVLNDPDGGDPDTTNTNEEGRFEFRFDELPPRVEGEFNLTIDAPGFQHYEKLIHFKVGKIFTEDISLEIGMMKKAA